MRRIALAALCAGLAVPTAFAQTIDLRMTIGERGVVARRGEHAGGGGDGVRLVLDDGTTCDGRLGPFAETRVERGGVSQTGLVAGVRACRPDASARPVLAIVRPRPRSAWPVVIAATDPRAVTAIALAESAGATAGHLRGTVAWDPPRVVELGDAIYVLVTGPACTGPRPSCAPRVAVVARARAGRAPDIVIARPAHPLWPAEDVPDAWFDWAGIVDVDGDGTIELVETQASPTACMVRLVRPSDRPEGDVVWLARHDGDPFDATVDRPPRPVHAR